MPESHSTRKVIFESFRLSFFQNLKTILSRKRAKTTNYMKVIFELFRLFEHFRNPNSHASRKHTKTTNYTKNRFRIISPFRKFSE